jgi:hypothetical protein
MPGTKYALGYGQWIDYKDLNVSDLDHEIEVVAGEIAAYLKLMEKPADTLEGITQWWIDNKYNHARHEVVEQALLQLIKNGAIEHKQLPDGTVVYAKKEI